MKSYWVSLNWWARSVQVTGSSLPCSHFGVVELSLPDGELVNLPVCHIILYCFRSFMVPAHGSSWSTVAGLGGDHVHMVVGLGRVNSLTQQYQGSLPGGGAPG